MNRAVNGGPHISQTHGKSLGCSGTTEKGSVIKKEALVSVGSRTVEDAKRNHRDAGLGFGAGYLAVEGAQQSEHNGLGRIRSPERGQKG